MTLLPEPSPVTLDTNRIRAVTFDSYSTLVDPRSAGRVLAEYVDDPGDAAARWHTLAVQYAQVANYVDAYDTYYALHRDALADLLAECGVDLTAAEIDEMTEVYYELDPFDDVRRGFERLADANLPVAVLSNGDPELLDSLVETTRTGDLVETTISADEIRTFKPDSALYEHAADRLDVPIERVVHVGAGWGDIMGCVHAGMQGVWLNRAEKSWPSFDGEPDLVADSMDEVVGAILDDD